MSEELTYTTDDGNLSITVQLKTAPNDSVAVPTDIQTWRRFMMQDGMTLDWDTCEEALPTVIAELIRKAQEAKK